MTRCIDLEIAKKNVWRYCSPQTSLHFDTKISAVFDMECKHGDLTEFSKMCALVACNNSKFGDRFFAFDSSQDHWETARYVHHFVSDELHHSPSGESPETSSSKRSQEISDEAPEQKRMKKANDKTTFEDSATDYGSEAARACELANICHENKTGSELENMPHESTSVSEKPSSADSSKLDLDVHHSIM